MFESKIPLHIRDTYDYDYLSYTTFRFFLPDFQLVQILLPNLAFLP